jgi:hypothetical protein
MKRQSNGREDGRMTKPLGKGNELKVKIISHSGFSGESTEKRVNKWLAENPDVDVLDIRYSEYVRDNGTNMDFCSLIIYKIATEKKSSTAGRAPRKKTAPEGALVASV